MDKTKVQIFEYDGKRISFDFGDGERMINATEMVKAFAHKGKRLNNFMRLKQTKEFIALLEEELNPVDSDVSQRKEAIKVIQGGVPELQGTWVEKRLALKIASWLEPRFELWIFDRIEDLLTKGQTSLHEKESEQKREMKALEWIFQKIKDNATEIHNLSGYLDDIKKYQEAFLRINNRIYEVQINGKKRLDVEFPTEATRDEIAKAILEVADVQKYLDGKAPKKVIVVPGRIINIVV